MVLEPVRAVGVGLGRVGVVLGRLAVPALLVLRLVPLVHLNI